MIRFNALILSSLLMLVGCSRFVPPIEPIPPEVTPPRGGGIGNSTQNIFEYPLFAGIDDLLAGDGWVRIGWESATDNDFETEELSYRIYLAFDSGHQDFSTPDLEIQQGGTSALIEGLTNGIAVHLVVRAVDPLGNEDPNEVEWAATPNPVRYVNHEASPVGGTGLTPETAFSSVGQAVGASLPLGGVNFHVAEGLYPENVFLFSGMFLYGGFDSTFLPDDRDGDLHLTQFASLFPTDLVHLNPGDLLTGIDSVSLSGQGIVNTGVVAEETWARITRCQIFDVAIHGVEFRSDYFDGDTVDGTLRGCVIEGCNGEGVLIDGIGNIVIDNNQIRSNLNEGIESQAIYSGFDQESRVEITRNVIRDNGDEGVDLDCRAASATDPLENVGSRMRLKIRNNRIFDNDLEGIVIDIDFIDLDGIDFRARIEDNVISANGTGGILLDGDARGAFRIARNVITANLGDGVTAQGNFAGPWFRIANCRILGNSGCAVRAGELATIEVRHCLLAHNGNGSIGNSRGYVDVTNSLLVENGPTSEASHLRWSMLQGDSPGATTGEGVISGDPQLVAIPLSVAFASMAGGDGSVVNIKDSSVWATGDTVEIADDGVPREVTAVNPGSIVIDPPAPGIRLSEAVMRWQPGAEVNENDHLTEESPAIAGGDPLEPGDDGNLPDLGPMGDNPLGSVGIETALPQPPDQIELIGIDPSPALPQTGQEWILQFTRELGLAMTGQVRIDISGADSSATLTNSVNENLLEVLLPSLPAHGSLITLEVLPIADGSGQGPDFSTDPGNPDASDLDSDRSNNTGGGIPLRSHLRLHQNAGTAFSEAEGDLTGINDTVASAEEPGLHPSIASGTIAGTGDVDIYRFDPASDGGVRIELLASRLGSPLQGRLELIASDGSTVLASSQATPPFFFDPVLPVIDPGSGGPFWVVVSAANNQGSLDHRYRILVRPSAP